MMNKIKSKIIIVDENDIILCYKNRNELLKNDIYRVSALWITNTQGEILFARRHRNKSHHPRRWASAVAGTVEEGETYLDNILKEAEEELGLTDIESQIKEGPKTVTNDEYHHFVQWYFLCIDKKIEEFSIQEDEVEEIKWFSPSELREQMQNNPEEFVPTMKKYFELFS